jgi:hypothetical protein
LKENVEAITVHRKVIEVKSTIKPFKFDINHVTGISNFSEISKDPLKYP